MARTPTCRPALRLLLTVPREKGGGMGIWTRICLREGREVIDGLDHAPTESLSFQRKACLM